MSRDIVDMVFDSETEQIEIRIPKADGTGIHVLAVLPATPPPGQRDE